MLGLYNRLLLNWLIYLKRFFSHLSLVHTKGYFPSRFIFSWFAKQTLKYVLLLKGMSLSLSVNNTSEKLHLTFYFSSHLFNPKCAEH